MSGKRSVFDDLFEAAPDAPSDAEALFDAAPDAGAVSTFKPGPAFKGNVIPMARGAAAPTPPDLNDIDEDQAKARNLSPIKPTGMDPSESGMVAGSQALSLNFADELGGALAAPFNSPTRTQQIVDEDVGSPGFMESALRAYDNEKNSLRKTDVEAKETNPKSYAGSYLAGSVMLPGSGVKNAVVQGGLSGVGASEDNAEVGGLAGGVAGGTVAGLIKKFPVLGGLGLSAAALAAVAKGDALGLSESDKYMLAAAGLAGLVGAGGAGVSKLRANLANKAGGVASRAEADVEARLVAKDTSAGLAMDKENAASKAKGMKLFDDIEKRLVADEGIPEASIKQIDADHASAFKTRRKDEAELGKAVEGFGKDKFKAFKEAVEDTGGTRLAAQKESDDALVDAFMAEESGVVPRQGAKQSPALQDEIAQFEASIPAKVQGKEAAEFGALLNRVGTFKAAGKPVPPELQSYVDNVYTQYEQNTPGFLEKYFRAKDPKGLAKEYEGELLAELNSMKARLGEPGAETSALSRDTVVGPPSEEHLAAAMKPKPTADDFVPRLEKEQIARDVGVDFPDHTPDPENAWLDFVASRNKEKAGSMKKSLGLMKAEPGEDVSPAVLVSDEEQKQIARNSGKSYLDRDEKGWEEIELANTMRKNRELYGSARDEIPTAAGKPAALEAGARKPVDPEAEDFEWPGYPSWSQVSSPDAPLAPSFQARDYFAKQNVADYIKAPTGEEAWHWDSLAPTMKERVAGEVAATGPKLKSAAMAGAVRGARNPLTIAPAASVGTALAGPYGFAVGGALGSAAGAINGSLARVNMLAERDPAVRARVFGAVQRLLKTNAPFAEKYGALVSGGISRTELLPILDTITKDDPEFEVALMDVLINEESANDL